MAAERTVERLQETADLLGMLEEIAAAGTVSRTALAGIRVTLRNAREAVVRSCVELKQIRPAEISPSSQYIKDAPPAGFQGEQAPAAAGTAGADEDRILLRRRDLRSSVEQVVDRS